MKPTPEEVAQLLGRALPPSDCSAAEIANSRLQNAQAALDRALTERPPGEQAVIDATLDANDRVRERRFAKGLPCLLTGLTKEQWEARKVEAPLRVALRGLLAAASLMRITMQERAPVLSRTSDWERLTDAMRVAEKALENPQPNRPDEGRGNK